MAASLGKMPTTSVRRLISPLRRSSGFVLWSLTRCAAGKPMSASTSGSAVFIRVASLGTSRLPVPITIAVALDQTLGALLAVGRASQAADLQLHQPFGRKADHLAQQIDVGALLHQPAQGHHLVGHRGALGFGVGARNPTLPGNHR